MTSIIWRIFVRKFSVTSVLRQDKMIPPPVPVFGMEGRYAAATYSAAKKKNTNDKVEKDLLEFLDHMKTNVPLVDFIINPGIKRALKAEGLKLISEKLGYAQETSNLLQCMAENGRLKLLRHVILTYKYIMSGSRREVVCDVVTAKELDSKQKERLEVVLKMFLNPDEVIKLNTFVNPNILGGMTVRIGDRYKNMSILEKIRVYEHIMRKAV